MEEEAMDCCQGHLFRAEVHPDIGWRDLASIS